MTSTKPASLWFPVPSMTPTSMLLSAPPIQVEQQPFPILQAPPSITSFQVITANGTLTITVDNGTTSVAAVNNGFDNQDKVTQSAVTINYPDGDTVTIDLTALTGESAL